MSFGEILKQLRKENNVKQKDLAKHLNFTREAISNYETNRKEPEFDTIKRIAEFFNVSIDFLLGHTDIRTPVDKKEEDSALMLNKLIEDNQKEFSLIRKIKENGIELDEIEKYVDFLISKKDK
ncbi:helix-turn-helix protein [Anaerobacterium chartisolvens]|uniref:Helix-turn-helix protein n=1 Tax=Anaerobacterium chartisolvens TaxID=1297424 RepID=A0A369AH55_9FIRM|nr:helix-turn-helix domain-containing protein [Anaerobacterium chartisolvens]RCX08679.1 helix-turn-helix protein [Anaerobacterium chartisolvens]